MLHQRNWFGVTKVRDRNTQAYFDPFPWELGWRDEQSMGLMVPPNGGNEVRWEGRRAS